MKKRKLNVYEVIEIHSRLAQGETQASIAQDYDVSQRTISGIARGETWPHLTPPPAEAEEEEPVTQVTEIGNEVNPRCIVLPDTGETTGDYGIWPDGTVITWKQREPAILKPRILPSGNRRVWLRCYDRRAGYLVRDLVRATWGCEAAW